VDYQWRFEIILLYKEAFLRGVAVTIALTIITISTGTVAGLALVLGRISPIRILSWSSMFVIEFFRALPLLVLLIWIYFCVPILFGVRISAFASAATGLSINLAAFVAETIRAGVESIPSGFTEAARALGMTKSQTMRRIILPQAVRQMMPALFGLYISMLKLSSLASVISVTELLHAANDVISQTYRPLEIYTTIAAIYVLLVLPGLIVSRKLESAALLKEIEGQGRKARGIGTGTR
jgi:polar amino acid transport system permease protein